MSKNLFIIFFLFIFSATVMAQNWNRIHMLDQEAEYMIINKLYKEAADIYIRILRELPGSSNLQFRIGYCFLNSEGNLDNAISHFREASSNVDSDANTGSLKEERAPLEAFLLLGVAFQRDNQFENAREAYIKFSGLLPPGDERIIIADQHLKSLEVAKDLKAKPSPVEMENLGRVINSNVANVNAVVSGDGQTMAFTRISRSGFNVFVARRQGESWGRPVNISSQLRRDFLKTTGLSYNGSVIYLVHYFPGRSDIFTSEYENKEWTRARNIGRPVNSRYNETHASVSADGNTLYFTSDRPGGFGELDIYRTTLDNRGRWGEVENLGPGINTPFNEETPFLTNDGRYLFFSSEGHNSMGGYDIFYAELEDNPVAHNMGYPLNNAGDNLFYFPFRDGSSGLISFYDEGGIGRSDIFLVSVGDPGIIYALSSDEKRHENDHTSVVDSDVLSVEEAGGVFFVPEDLTEPEQRTTLPAHSAEGRSYSVQFLALSEPVRSEMADTLQDVIIYFDRDGFSRLMSGHFRTEAEAMPVLMHYRENGYPDAFIRINNYIPNFTIQIKAMKNYLERDYFNDLDEVICMPGNDGLHRYMYGFYTSQPDAVEQAIRLSGFGYEDLFIKSIDW